MASFQENETVRIETFSDGVLAINITLLMFELKAPEFKENYNSRTLFVAMLNQWPAYMAFVLSFSTIFVIWVNHHRMFNMIRQSDARFMSLNGLLLFLTSLIPFTTNILSKYSTTSATELSTGLSMGLFGLITGTLSLMWNYAVKDYHLLKRPSANVRVRTVRNALLISTGVYGLAMLVALLLPSLSLLIGMFMVVYLSQLKYHREKVV